MNPRLIRAGDFQTVKEVVFFSNVSVKNVGAIIDRPLEWTCNIRKFPLDKEIPWFYMLINSVHFGQSMIAPTMVLHNLQYFDKL